MQCSLCLLAQQGRPSEQAEQMEGLYVQMCGQSTHTLNYMWKQRPPVVTNCNCVLKK